MSGQSIDSIVWPEYRFNIYSPMSSEHSLLQYSFAVPYVKSTPSAQPSSSNLGQSVISNPAHIVAKISPPPNPSPHSVHHCQISSSVSVLDLSSVQSMILPSRLHHRCRFGCRVSRCASFTFVTTVRSRSAPELRDLAAAPEA